jgi:hypothetical protein
LISLLSGAAPLGPCQLYVPPRAAVLLAFPIAGTAFSQRCRFPNAAALLGLVLSSQVIARPTASALGADLSNGVILTLGH